LLQKNNNFEISPLSPEKTTNYWNEIIGMKFILLELLILQF